MDHSYQVDTQSMEKYSLIVRWTLSNYEDDELITIFHLDEINLDIIFAAIISGNMTSLTNRIMHNNEDVTFHNSLDNIQREVLYGSKMESLVTALQLFTDYILWQ